MDKIFDKNTLNKIDYCPITLFWFKYIRAYLMCMPEKGQIPRNKLLLALYQSVCSKFSIKHFATIYNVPYGTARNWSSELKNE
jgi:hypothetical protein